MKATHIYINSQGVPCATTMEAMDKYKWPLIEQLKQSAIPIREEDRVVALKMLWDKDYKSMYLTLPSEYFSNINTFVNPDIFYPVEPYEFQIEECKVIDSAVPTHVVKEKVARIIPISQKSFNDEGDMKPTDDEIEKTSNEYAINRDNRYLHIEINAREGFKKGAKWARDKQPKHSNEDCPSDCKHPNCECSYERNVQFTSSMNRKGISNFWLNVFSEFQNWYGDFTKKETDEIFLRRLQASMPIQQPKFKTLEDWGWQDGWGNSIVLTSMCGYEVFVKANTHDCFWRKIGGKSHKCNNPEHGKQLAEEDYKKRVNELHV